MKNVDLMGLKNIFTTLQVWGAQQRGTRTCGGGEVGG